MKVMIIGAGYVGLTMGVVLSVTHEITLLDVDEDKVKAINEMKSPIHEKGISDLLTRGISEGRLRAMTPDEILGRHDIRSFRSHDANPIHPLIWDFSIY